MNVSDLHDDRGDIDDGMVIGHEDMGGVESVGVLAWTWCGGGLPPFGALQPCLRVRKDLPRCRPSMVKRTTHGNFACVVERRS